MSHRRLCSFAEIVMQYRGSFHSALRTLLAVCLSGLLVTCGSNSSSGPPPPPPPPNQGSIVWKRASTVPLEQMTGDVFQFFVKGNLNFYPTASMTVTNSGAAGTDLGIPVSFPGKVIFLWGDTTPVYPAIIENVGPGFYLGRIVGDDSIGMIADSDLSPCNAIPALYAQLTSLLVSTVDYSHCPTLVDFNRPDRRDQTAAFQPITIAGLGPNEGTGLLEVPTGAFSYNNRLYMFHTVTVLSDLGFQFDPNHPPNFPITSILAKSTTTSEQWTALNPPTFSKLYDVSAIPPETITTAPYSLDNPPPETTNPGKFIFVAPRLLQAAAISNLSWYKGLPSSLQSAPSVLFMFGTSWHFGHSNMYLALVSAQDLEATDGLGGPDRTKWWYYAGTDNNGNPLWSHNEVSASPLIDSWIHGGPAMDKHAVAWVPELNHFIVHYQDRDLESRSAFAPWGPWSAETSIFSKDDPTWGVSIGHHPGQDSITKYAVPPVVIYDKATGLPIEQQPSEGAFIYGGYFLDRYSVNADKSVTMYITVSTYSPYAVFLMKTTYCLDTTSTTCN